MKHVQHCMLSKNKIMPVKIFLRLVVILWASGCSDGDIGEAKQCLESGCKGTSNEDCTVRCNNMNLTDGLPKINPHVRELEICDSLMPTIKSYNYEPLVRLVKVYINASNVTHVNIDAFERMPNIELLHIEHNNLTSVLNAGFNLKHLNELSLIKNNIRNINFSSTKLIKNKLKISLSHNPIKNILPGTFTGFKDIKNVSLFLRDIQIRKLAIDTFSGLNELNELDISDNDLGADGLESIANSITGKNIKILTAANCSMKSVKPESFEKLSHVQRLNLSCNFWETWPNNTLKHLKNLESLTINDSPYFAFFEASNEMKNVKYLSFHSNALLKTNTISIIFNNSQKLEYLNISDNHFQDRVKEISPLETLKVFDMSQNNHPLVKERVNYYKIMPNLTTFNMRNVNSEHQEEGDFDLGDVALTNMSYLQNLDLSHNTAILMNEHVKFSYSGLKSLKNVNLSYNKLQDYHSALLELFKLFASVEILDLSGNSLIELPKHMFESLTALTELHLEDNRLTYFSKRYLRRNLNIKSLHLQINSIKYISGLAFVHLQHLSMLNISQNSFLCNCKLRKFRDWMQHRKYIVHGYDQKCVIPSAMNKSSIISFEISWIECDNMWIILVALIVTICLILGILLTYFRWDIKYWWILRRSRRRRNGYTELNDTIGGRYQYDGFVSYNGESQKWVIDYMLPNMEQSQDDVNFKICFDGRDFIPGKYIADNIIDSIQQSRKLIFVITEKFIKSQWCGFELEMANLRQFDEKRNLVVLIFLEAIPKKKLPRKIRLLMKHMTYIEWDKENARAQSLFWKKLKLCMMDEPNNLMFGQNP
ncbi:unnamed protein product [Owenia fusiformis]|uniref:TIR domain-containing protein n=1 Tax=Owenia fusiformis TaxID=6347 RepID=A0A8J1T7V5_OWEFU|nr:unnamed protein product [Owenia fusiformis]